MRNKIIFCLQVYKTGAWVGRGGGERGLETKKISVAMPFWAKHKIPWAALIFPGFPGQNPGKVYLHLPSNPAGVLDQSLFWKQSIKENVPKASNSLQRFHRWSIRAVIHNMCCGWVCFMGPWCYSWTFVQLMQFPQTGVKIKATGESNFMTALIPNQQSQGN